MGAPLGERRSGLMVDSRQVRILRIGVLPPLEPAPLSLNMETVCASTRV